MFRSKSVRSQKGTERRRSFFSSILKAPKAKISQFKLPKDFAKTVLELEIKLDRREFTLNNLNTLLGLYTVSNLFDSIDGSRVLR